MRKITKTVLVVTITLCALSLLSLTTNKSTKKITKQPDSRAKIQVAILLDVSGSMNGLIEQAKSQLWNMASVMGRAKCEDYNPEVEIALYEYGRPENGVAGGYVKQVNGFSTDLDKLSKSLFSLRTSGGDEYCGKVIYTSLNDLQWDPSPTSYKVIFIAGNEDFRQGPTSFYQACLEAKRKGVIVNTIFCGNRDEGIRLHWNLADECGSGSYTNIDHNAREKQIPTPFDSTLFVLNSKLNDTYVYYGRSGATKYAEQAEVDRLNNSMNLSAAMKRVSVKGSSNVYKNSSWDLVDAFIADSSVLETLDVKTLPPVLSGKTRKEVATYIRVKNAERNNVRKQIAELSSKREAYIKQEKGHSNTITLETEVERIIKLQAQRFKMKIADQ